MPGTFDNFLKDSGEKLFKDCAEKVASEVAKSACDDDEISLNDVAKFATAAAIKGAIIGGPAGAGVGVGLVCTFAVGHRVYRWMTE